MASLLYLCVFLDMLAVAVLIPHLPTILTLHVSGVSLSTSEYLSLTYYLCQIVGSMLIRTLFDKLLAEPRRQESSSFARYCVSNKNRLLLLSSFLGSCLSYTMLFISTSPTLCKNPVRMVFASRIVVGLVKQTQCVATTMLAGPPPPSPGSAAAAAKKTDSTAALAYLSATSTLAWILGPSLGEFVACLPSNTLGYRSLPLVSAGLFAVNFALCFAKGDWRGGTTMAVEEGAAREEKKGPPGSEGSAGGSASVNGHLSRDPVPPPRSSSSSSSPITSPLSTTPVIFYLLYNLISRSTAPSAIPSFYSDRYGLPPSSRGYLLSYLSILSFLAQAFVAERLARLLHTLLKSRSFARVRAFVRPADEMHLLACLSASVLAFSLLLLGGSRGVHVPAAVSSLDGPPSTPSFPHAPRRSSLFSFLLFLAPVETMTFTLFGFFAKAAALPTAGREADDEREGRRPLKSRQSSRLASGSSPRRSQRSSSSSSSSTSTSSSSSSSSSVTHTSSSSSSSSTSSFVTLLDVGSSVVGVVSPLYRTFLYSLCNKKVAVLASASASAAAAVVVEGTTDTTGLLRRSGNVLLVDAATWQNIAAAHWAGAAIAFWGGMAARRRGSQAGKSDDEDEDEEDDDEEDDGEALGEVTKASATNKKIMKEKEEKKKDR